MNFDVVMEIGDKYSSGSLSLSGTCDKNVKIKLMVNLQSGTYTACVDSPPSLTLHHSSILKPSHLSL